MELQIVVAAIVLVVVIIILLGVRVVPQGTNDVIERLGKFHRTLRPGLNLIIPIVDSRRARVNVMERVLDIPPQVVITKDNVSVRIDGAIFIQVAEAQAATYEVTNLELAVQTLAQTNLRATVGAMELDEALSKRDQINERILSAVQETGRGWGTIVKRVEVADLSPPQEVLDAMAVQLQAERKKRAAILEADGDKQAAILRADGDREAAILIAQGEAEARRVTAAAEADALRMITEAAEGAAPGSSLRYLLGQAHIAALQSVVSANGTRTVILPAELSEVASLVEGLRTIGSGDGGGRPSSRGPAPSGGAPSGGASGTTPSPWG